MRDATGVTYFFHHPATNRLHERIGRSVMLNSLVRSLQCSLQHVANSHQMYQTLRLRFHTLSRASMLNLFCLLKSFTVLETASTPEIAAEISEIFNDVDDMGVPYTRNVWAGLFLQDALRSVLAIQEELDCCLEIDYQSATPEGPPMGFDGMVTLIDIVRTQLNIQADNQSTSQNPAPPAMQTEALPVFPQTNNQQFQQPSGNQMVHPDNVPDVFDFMAMQAGLCWQCRLPDHLLCECPLRQRPQTTQQRFQPRPPPTTTQQNFPPPAPTGFQPFYPIVAPPVFVGIYPQPQGPAQNSRPPVLSNFSSPQVTRPADNYRPQYWLQQVSQTPESSSQQPCPSANEVSGVSSLPESLARMVELGDVAEDLANLQFDHVLPDESDSVPIVDSATLANNAFITGEGDLTFNGVDNQQVTIHGVLYC
ncbi:hypothetical protein PTTG_28934 [Puccinia triticina 1-1 BBBD Race 1]|uniref:CCHC-type domain-containing protein n=1 Tax=Puccinia triticina (isolate 1-1 / race 1 (BBBD)) TaxID=630390 RepID=A0A180G7R4_PUCT1|nr:hypothetical protein PTTG_28934 [Puccinia triticina 1-1 BBBD Race 1]